MATDRYPDSPRPEITRCPNCGNEIELGKVAVADEEREGIRQEGDQPMCPECGEALTTKGGPQDPIDEEKSG